MLDGKSEIEMCKISFMGWDLYRGRGVGWRKLVR